MTLTLPPALLAGDTIALAATARKMPRHEMVAAIKLLQAQGYVVAEGPHLYDEDHQFAGNDSDRAADLQAALDNPEVKAVLFSRGGYGTVRIIDRLDFSRFKEHPKWLAGFSDLTVLHSHVNRHAGVATLHAPMMINLASVSDASRQLFFELLGGGRPEIKTAPDPLNIPGEATGMLTGGNLSVLYSLLGSASDIDTAGKILFLEDLDEYLYHVDRMMQALNRAGKLDKLAGLVVGGMSDMKDNTVPFGKDAETIIREVVAPFGYPVCFGFPAGHIEHNLPLVLGAEVTLSVGEAASLRYNG